MDGEAVRSQNAVARSRGRELVTVLLRPRASHPLRLRTCAPRERHRLDRASLHRRRDARVQPERPHAPAPARTRRAAPHERRCSSGVSLTIPTSCRRGAWRRCGRWRGSRMPHVRLRWPVSRARCAKVLGLQPARSARRQHDRPIPGDDERVLVMRRETAVARPHRPAVGILRGYARIPR